MSQNLLLDEIAQALATPLPLAHGRDDSLGGRDADVGHQQDFFERLRGVDVDVARARLRRVGALDDVVELVDELLRGPLQPLL